MRTPTQSYRKKSPTSSCVGSTDCISYPYHSLHLQEKLSRLADASYMSKSMLIRKWIEKEWKKFEDQMEA